MLVLVAGTGSIGRRHIENIRRIVPEARFLLFRNGCKEDDFSRSLGAETIDDWPAVIAHGPSFAVIATPTHMHAEALLPLISAGIPVYVEKPVAHTPADLERLESALDSAVQGPPSMVGCTLRWLPSLRKVKAFLEANELGRVVRANLQVGQWLPDWRPERDYKEVYSARAGMGGGVLLDLIHELDMARWLFGEFDQVKAVAGRLSSLDLDVEDTAQIILSREGGPIVAVGMDYVARRPLRRYEIVGDEATLVWDLAEGRLDVQGPEDRRPVPCGSEDFDLSGTYESAMRDWIEAVRQGKTAAPDIRDGMATLRLALQAKEDAGL